MTDLQRLSLALYLLKESLIDGLRRDWLLYLVVFWLGIIVGGLAGWIEWGPR